MQFTVEDLSSVKKMLHIEIPADEVARELDTAYKKLMKTAKIKGFRPGKAPRSVLERMFKKDVHADVTSRLIQESFVDAVKQTDLKIVGNPKVDPPELDAEGPYNYDATVEVNPEIENIDYKGLKLEKTMYQVGDEEIDAQLKALQKNLARLEPIKGQRPLKSGDVALIDYEGFKDGKPFVETQRTENFSLKIGDGVISKDFDEALAGMIPGENKEVEIQFAKDHFNQKLAGNTITFRVKLNEIRQEVLPKIDDEMAEKLGDYKTLAELKTAIADNLAQGYDKRIEQELNEQILKQLIDAYEFEVPDVLIEYELEGIVQEAERSFSYQGVSMEQMGFTKESLSEKYRDTAVKQVKRHLILSKIIEQESLTLSDEDLEKGFGGMADSLNRSVEEIRQYYQQNKDNLEFFKHTLLEKKAITLILDSSSVKEVKPGAETKSKKKK
ncbi:MAG: trigger factor [Desulfobacterales bacterium]|jgi:trigger factor